MRLKIALSLVIFLSLTLGFNGFLISSSFKKNNRKNYYSLTTTIGKRIKMYIETGLIFGKKLDSFYGLKKLLQKNISNWKFLTNAIVTDTKGDILGSAYPIKNKHMSLWTKMLIGMYRANPDSKVLTSPAGYLLCLPIEKHERIKGYLVLSIDKSINARAKDLIEEQVIIILIIISTAFISLLILIWWLSNSKSTTTENISLSRIISVLFIAVQLIYAIVATREYQNRFTSTIREKIFYVHDSLSHDIQYLLSKGVSLDHVRGIDSYLKQILYSNEEIKTLEILDTHKRILYKATRPTKYSSLLKFMRIFHTERTSLLLDKNNKPAVYVKTIGNPDFIIDQTLEIYLDTATIIILCLIFLGEISRIFSPVVSSIQGKGKEKSFSLEEKGVTYLRIISFLFFFSYDMPMSFIPIYMKQFHIIPMRGIPVDVILSLPITAEIVFATISTMCGGIVTERFGWTKTLALSILFATAGLLLAGLVPGPWIYILARSMAGIALGLTLISLQSSISHSPTQNKAHAISNIFAGVLAGSLCGSVTGAMLADQRSYAAVFIVAGIISVLLSGYILYLLNKVKPKPSVSSLSHEERENTLPPEGDTVTSLWSWINVRTLSLIVCISIPVAMTLVGVLYYLVPVYLKEIGTSQGNIGRVIMLYGLCIIYGSPFISRMVEHRNKLKIALGTGVISLCSIIPLVLLKGLFPAAIAVFFVGMANAVGAGCLVVYFLELTSSVHLSEHKKISIYRTLERVGQILGSVVFAFFVGSFGMHRGLGMLLVVFVVLLSTFYIIQRRSHVTPCQ